MEIGELPGGSEPVYPLVKIDHVRSEFTLNGQSLGSSIKVIPLGLLRSRTLRSPSDFRRVVCSSADAITGFPRAGFPAEAAGFGAQAPSPAPCSACNLRGFDAEGGWRCKQAWTVPFLFFGVDYRVATVHSVTFSPAGIKNLEPQLIRFRDNNIPTYTEVLKIRLREVLHNGISFADSRFEWAGKTDPVGHATYSAHLQRFRAYMAEDTASEKPTIFEGF